jgi:hypothetical protein
VASCAATHVQAPFQGLTASSARQNARLAPYWPQQFQQTNIVQYSVWVRVKAQIESQIWMNTALLHLHNNFRSVPESPGTGESSTAPGNGITPA